MSHPFEKIFEKSIAKSRGDENHVLGEAEKMREKGYSPDEIFTVLKKLHTTLISDADRAILSEAVEEFSRHIDTQDSEE